MARCIDCGRFVLFGLQENRCNDCYNKVAIMRLRKCIVCGKSQYDGLHEDKWCDECYAPILAEKEKNERHLKRWAEVRRTEGSAAEIRSKRYRRCEKLIEEGTDAQAEILDRIECKRFTLDMVDKVFAVVDFETTGLKEIESEIIEIGAVKVSNGEVIGEFDQLSLPYMGLNFDAMEVNGITMDMVEDKPLMKEVFPKFLKFIEDCDYLVFHNAKFDVQFFLCDYMLNSDPPYKRYNCVDTYTLAREVWKTEVANYKLETLARYVGHKQKNAHRAIDDARACYAVLLAEAKRVQGDADKKELRTQLRAYLKKNPECMSSEIEHEFREYEVRTIHQVLDEFADNGNLIIGRNSDGYTTYSYTTGK